MTFFKRESYGIMAWVFALNSLSNPDPQLVRASPETSGGGRIAFFAWVYLLCLIRSKSRDPFDNPEHRGGAYRVRRNEFGPARQWNADAADERDERQHHADEQEVPRLDAGAEEKQRGRYVSGRQSGFAQSSGKS